MALALFDLDNTLLAGDSDHLWGEFLADQGVVERDWYKSENLRYYRAYVEGTLDIREFLNFSLKPLSEHPRERLDAWHRRFMQEKIEPVMLPAARRLIERHRDAGDRLLVITATNAFVTRPIARAFGIDDLLATEPEIVDGRYTGRVTGIPCFQEGKVLRLQAWIRRRGESLSGSHCYSDSINDLPLLNRVEHPVIVDPDPRLHEEAVRRGWPVITLRRGPVPAPLDSDGGRG